MANVGEPLGKFLVLKVVIKNNSPIKDEKVFNKEIVRVIRDKLEKTLEPLAKELGCSIDVGSATFTLDNIRFKLEVSRVENGMVLNPDASNFKALASVYGLKPEHLGAKFQYGGKQYTITGLAPRRGRFPILANDERGKGYKFPLEIVKTLVNH